MRATAVISVFCVVCAIGRAQTTPPAAGSDSCCPAPGSAVSTRGRIALSTSMRDTDRVVTARLMVKDSAGHESPLANATVGFYIQRLFGILPAGEDHTATTNENGEAELVFPAGIPGDPKGDLTVVARVEENDQLADVRGYATATWGTPVLPNPEPFPRAMWEPRAPFPMILTFAILFGGVWIAYGIVFAQIFIIKKNKKHENSNVA